VRIGGKWELGKLGEFGELGGGGMGDVANGEKIVSAPARSEDHGDRIDRYLEIRSDKDIQFISFHLRRWST